MAARAAQLKHTEILIYMNKQIRETNERWGSTIHRSRGAVNADVRTIIMAIKIVLLLLQYQK